MFSDISMVFMVNDGYTFMIVEIENHSIHDRSSYNMATREFCEHRRDEDRHQCSVLAFYVWLSIS